MDTMAEIRQTFFLECEEQLIELEAGLLAIQGGSRDSELVNAVFRAVHSIKGGAGAFDLGAIVGFAHVFENTLDLVRTGALAPEAGLVAVMLRAADQLSDLVIAGRDGVPVDETRCGGLVEELSAFLQETSGVPSPSDGAPIVFEPVMVDFSAFDDFLAFEPTPLRYRIDFKPSAALYEKGNETAILFREVRKLGALTTSCDIGGLPPLADLVAEESYFDWTLRLESACSEDAIREIFDFCEWDSEIAIAVESAAGDDFALPDLEWAMPDEDHAPRAPDETMAPESAPVAVAVVKSEAAESEVAKSEVAKSEVAKSEVAKSETTKIEATADTAKPVAANATIRVDLDRLDQLIDLVGELVINQAMLAERVADLGLPRMSPVGVGIDELEQLTRQLQDSVMGIRAQPVRSVFQRLPRLVREVASQTGKSVLLVTEGEGTEVDKTVIERLIDPLTHMVRNAIDHGLEKPEARRAKGKSDEGTLRIAALHRSGRIVIEISDDGAGIDRERVKSIAIGKNLVAADARLTDEEIDNLIFLPGFSTAETVSAISGRGVGMDVVRRSIQALGGRISIASTPGHGSVFTLSLPLTLAVLDGMIVSVAGQTLVVPLNAIIEILMPQSIAVHGLGAEDRVIGLRGAFIPLVDVGRTLGYRSDAIDPKTGVMLLVENESGLRNALLVDAIQSQRQVVIKSLEANYGTVAGIAAATILGDGRVALILDIDAIMTDARAERVAPEPAVASRG